MIDKEDEPVSWEMLCFELTDAAEHIQDLLRDMHEGDGFSEESFRVGMAHVYAHLNRAWHRRDVTDSEVHAYAQE